MTQKPKRSEGEAIGEFILDMVKIVLDPVVDRHFTYMSGTNRIMVREVRKSGEEDIKFYVPEK